LAKRISSRKLTQIGMGVLQNAHLSGFLSGKIYQGPLKHFCVPGMNCYSCPAAIGACPIGSFQSMLAARQPKVSLSIVGFLSLIGVLAGRFVCGWLCLFGLIQELLYKIPVKKIRISAKTDRILRKTKYVVLVLFVILFPVILRDEYGLGIPSFCKWLCPVGTLEAGMPLYLLDQSIRGAAHFLFVWKFAILLFCIGSAIVIERPFCKYLCPLGAFYSLFQSVSFLQLKLDKEKCVNCGKCESVCPMQVNVRKSLSSAECIRCGECVRHCEAKALRFAFEKEFKKSEVPQKG